MERLQVSLDDDEAASVRVLAEQHTRSVSEMGRVLIREALGARARLAASVPNMGRRPRDAAAVEAAASVAVDSDPRGAYTAKAPRPASRLGHEFVPQPGNPLKCNVEGCGRKLADH